MKIWGSNLWNGGMGEMSSQCSVWFNKEDVYNKIQSTCIYPFQCQSPIGQIKKIEDVTQE